MELYRDGQLFVTRTSARPDFQVEEIARSEAAPLSQYQAALLALQQAAAQQYAPQTLGDVLGVYDQASANLAGYYQPQQPAPQAFPPSHELGYSNWTAEERSALAGVSEALRFARM